MKKELELKYDEKLNSLVNTNEIQIKDLQDQIKEISINREKKGSEYNETLQRFERDHEMRLQHMNDEVIITLS